MRLAVALFGIGSSFGAVSCGGTPDVPRPEDAKPVEQSPFTLTSVWGSSPQSVWAVGEGGTVVRFDGDHWSAVDSGTTSDLYGVTGSSDSDVWAVGDDAIVHCDASACSVVMKGMFELLLDAWQSGPDDLWASGLATDDDTGIVRHWNGSSWEFAETSEGHVLWDVWGTGPNDVWTGGSRLDGTGFLARGDGTTFDETTYQGGSLRGLWGSAANDLWVATYEGDTQHWDGSTWTSFPNPSGQPLLRLGGTGKDVWAVGMKGTVLRWDGASWTTMAPSTTENLKSVWASSSNDVWAVGGHGTLVHWDGTSWMDATNSVIR